MGEERPQILRQKCSDAILDIHDPKYDAPPEALFQALPHWTPYRVARVAGMALTSTDTRGEYDAHGRRSINHCEHLLPPTFHRGIILFRSEPDSRAPDRCTGDPWRARRRFLTHRCSKEPQHHHPSAVVEGTGERIGVVAIAQAHSYEVTICSGSLGTHRVWEERRRREASQSDGFHGHTTRWGGRRKQSPTTTVGHTSTPFAPSFRTRGIDFGRF